MRPPDLSDETQRLASLRALHVLDSPRDERFDRITRLASQIFGTPVATIGFIDSERLWFKSTQGMYLREASRDTSFCSHTIASGSPMVIQDARRDPRFADNPTVVGEPFLRFYAGHPIAAPDQKRVGSLCVVDYRPRVFTDADTRTLTDLAAWVEQLLHDPLKRHGRLERVLSRDHGDDHPRVDRVTRVWNGPAIVETVRRELAHAREEKRPLAVVVLRVDGMESLTSTAGTARRDFVLAEISQRIRACLRPYDVVGRSSSDQFLAVLLSADLARGAIASERLRDEIASVPIRTATGPISVTVSVGTACSADLEHGDHRQLIGAATSAMERASKSGGNRTMMGGLS